MHIPDGYLSPQTYLPLYGGFAVIAAVAVAKLKRTVDTRLVPYVGMAAAFSFLIMMFNIPIPGGTTGHAVGGGDYRYSFWALGGFCGFVYCANHSGAGIWRWRNNGHWGQLF